MQYGYNGENLIVRWEAIDENGLEGVITHEIHPEAIAARMELLGIDDPGVAYEIIRAEEFAVHENPYQELMDRCHTCAHTPDEVEHERILTLNRLPVEIKADAPIDHGLKEFIREGLGPIIELYRAVAHQALFRTPTEEELRNDAEA